MRKKGLNTLSKESILENILEIKEQLVELIEESGIDEQDCLSSDNFSECILDLDDEDYVRILTIARDLSDYVGEWE